MTVRATSIFRLSPILACILPEPSSTKRTLASAASAPITIAQDASAGAASAAWLEDGTIVYIDESTALRRIPASGGTGTILLREKAGTRQSHELLAPLPGSRGVLVTSCPGNCSIDATVSVLDFAADSLRELVPDAPVVAVSAVTGSGLDELREALDSVADTTTPRRADFAARLYVDRVFTLRGIGTVVTGTLWSGTIAEGDRLRLEPAGREVRVRSVQVHDRAVERTEAGQRVAVNLPGVERQDVRRGDVGRPRRPERRVRAPGRQGRWQAVPW